jgi:hypothetical protein
MDTPGACRRCGFPCDRDGEQEIGMPFTAQARVVRPPRRMAPVVPINRYRVRRGMGQDTGASYAVGVASSIGTPVATQAIAPTVASTLGLTGNAASLAIPIVGAAIAGLTFAVEYLLTQTGCGQTCVITSNWANQAETTLEQNIQQYFAVPAPRPQSVQNLALANFDTVWNYLVQQCSNPSVGNAGKTCISDRQAGSCKWTQTTTSPLLTYPGEPQPGACWNWFSGYRDPIANDPDVAPDTVTSELSTATSALSSATGLSSSILYLIGAALLIYVASEVI